MALLAQSAACDGNHYAFWLAVIGLVLIGLITLVALGLVWLIWRREL
jgi:hypothetical protein